VRGYNSNMRTRFAVLLLAVTFVGCKSPKKSGLFNGPIAPTLAGDWNGSFQMAGTTPGMTMGLTQSNINVNGIYNATQVSGLKIGEQGTVAGLSTGQSFTLKFSATTPGCAAKIDINGFNSGDELAFNFSGVDCSCTTVSGQGYCQRP
jgi:hypothetical protein